MILSKAPFVETFVKKIPLCPFEFWYCTQWVSERCLRFWMLSSHRAAHRGGLLRYPTAGLHICSTRRHCQEAVEMYHHASGHEIILCADGLVLWLRARKAYYKHVTHMLKHVMHMLKTWITCLKHYTFLATNVCPCIRFICCHCCNLLVLLTFINICTRNSLSIRTCLNIYHKFSIVTTACMDTFNHMLSIFAKHSIFQYQIIIPLRRSFSSGRPI